MPRASSVTGLGIATFGRSGGSTSPVGENDTTADGVRSLACRPGSRETRPEITKVIGGALLAIRLIAGSHSPLEITFPSIVLGARSNRSCHSHRSRTNSEARVSCRYDRLFPSAISPHGLVNNLTFVRKRKRAAHYLSRYAGGALE